MKLKLLILWYLGLSFFFTPQLFASNVKSGEEVTITEPVSTNLYVAASKINVQSILEKDLMATGGEIFIGDTIRQDALLAGGKITMAGVIGEDLRIIGGSIHIRGDVLGDLTITGGEVDIADGVTIYGDLLIAGGQVRFAGLVKGLTTLAGGKVVLDGTAEGPVEMNAGVLEVNGELRGPSSLIAQELKIGKMARFMSDVQYYSQAGEVNFGGRLYNNAKATFNPDLKPEYESWSGWKNWKQMLAGMFIFRFLAASLIIVLLVAMFHRFFADTAIEVKEKIVNNLGIGALYLVGVPALIIIAFITVIGIPAGLIATTFYGISLALGRILVSVLGAYVLEDYLSKAWTKGQMMLVSIGAYVLLSLLGWIPILGSLISILLMLVTFGAIIQEVRQHKYTAQESKRWEDVES